MWDALCYDHSDTRDRPSWTPAVSFIVGEGTQHKERILLIDRLGAHAFTK